jgi:type II secretory pathway predicted ATPase ExeA
MECELSGNPFEMKTVHDLSDFEMQPFLLLKNQRILKTKLDFNLKSNFPIYQIIIGDRGAGKSTSLLYLYKALLEKEINIYYLNRPLTDMNNLAQLLGIKIFQTKIYSKINEDEEDNSISSKIKNLLKNKKTYLFIDMPDKVTTGILNDFLGLLETLLDIKELSIFIAMNRSHYNRSFSHSEILGKYVTIELEPFEYEETEQLIIERLKTVKDNNGIKPFTEESLQKIHSFSGGIPRNILSACDLLLMGAIESDRDLIDGEFTSKKLQSEFAYKIIDERIKDKTTRDALKRIYNFIKLEFKGKIEQEKEFQQKFVDKYGGASQTLRKRIRFLEKLGLIEIKKNPSDMWSNMITIKG